MTIAQRANLIALTLTASVACIGHAWAGSENEPTSAPPPPPVAAASAQHQSVQQILDSMTERLDQILAKRPLLPRRY